MVSENWLHVVCAANITHSRFQGCFAPFQDAESLLCAFDEFIHLRLDDLPEIGFVFPDGGFGN